MTILIPQLPAAGAMPLLEAIASADPAELDPGTQLRHPQAFTLPTGGLPVEDGLLVQLRDPVVAAARDHGFPSVRPAGFLAFELMVAEILAEWPPLWNGRDPSGEALRNDCWTFLTIVVLADVAAWRWPSGEGSPGRKAWQGRMLGGMRNTFQRIFRRVMCLDRGPDHPDRWGLIRDLQEDDFSAILERPGLSSNRDIAVCLAEEYIAMKRRLQSLGAAARTSVYRQATKAVRAYGVVQPLDLLTAERRSEVVHAAFAREEERVLSGEETSGTGAAGQEAPAETREIQVLPADNAEEAAERNDGRSRPGFLRRLLQGE